MCTALRGIGSGATFGGWRGEVIAQKLTCANTGRDEPPGPCSTCQGPEEVAPGPAASERASPPASHIRRAPIVLLEQGGECEFVKIPGPTYTAHEATASAASGSTDVPMGGTLETEKDPWTAGTVFMVQGLLGAAHVFFAPVGEHRSQRHPKRPRFRPIRLPALGPSLRSASWASSMLCCIRGP